jgi:hypothetical protein
MNGVERLYLFKFDEQIISIRVSIRESPTFIASSLATPLALIRVCSGPRLEGRGATLFSH